MANEASRAAASTTARIVWDTADKYLRNVVEPQEYGDYILPFTVLRRLECLLEDTKDDVIKFVKAQGDMPSYLIDIAVSNRFGLSFFNTSQLNLARIASVDDNVDRALLRYVNGFSHNIADIWTAFEFPKLVAKLSAANRLLEVVKHFSTLSLGSTSVEDSTMGDIFEDVMYRAFDKKGKAAGAFYTPRDAIKLMVDVLFAADAESLAGEDVLRSIYDPTAGSGGMLLVAQEALRELNPGVKVTVYGQEMMDSAYALGKADLLIQGGRPDAILKGDTLLEDLHADKTFDYVLSNPPFGGDWEVEQASVKEQAQVPGSRFSHGLPSKSDGQMLFLCHCASKLSPSGGRAAVVSNASPLFNSDTGPNSIRQWLFDEDLIDAIIALPTQMFYGTGIATYVWILDNDKPLKRRGKIQLLDASGLWEPMRKGMGDKRREMSEANREAVVQAYQRFEDSEISRILTPQDFMFRDVPVFKQARLATRYSDEAVDTLRGRRDFSEALVRVMRELDGTPWNELPLRIRATAKTEGIKVSVGLIDAVMKAMAVPDDNAPLAVDRKGTPVLADGWKIMERVPASEDLEEHMATEVLPFAPGATWDESKAKKGNEIPFTRIFYVPEEPRPLAEIDADVQRIMGELAEMFAEVHRDE
jgi:type I restriction-modification system, methyltransferase subunit